MIDDRAAADCNDSLQLQLQVEHEIDNSPTRSVCTQTDTGITRGDIDGMLADVNGLME